MRGHSAIASGSHLIDQCNNRIAGNGLQPLEPAAIASGLDGRILRELALNVIDVTERGEVLDYAS